MDTEYNRQNAVPLRDGAPAADNPSPVPAIKFSVRAQKFPVTFCRELLQNWPNLRTHLRPLEAQSGPNAENSLSFPL